MIKMSGTIKRKIKDTGSLAQVDAIVAIGQAHPSVGQSPNNLTQCQGDHHEAHPNGAQTNGGEDHIEKKC